MVYRKIEWYNYHAIVSSLCHSLPPAISQGFAAQDVSAGAC